jgi:hypothetical protein
MHTALEDAGVDSGDCQATGMTDVMLRRRRAVRHQTKPAGTIHKPRPPVELLAMFRVPVLLALLSLLTSCNGWYVSQGASQDRRSAIEKAAGAGDVTEVRRLLAGGADPNGPSIFGVPLNAAAAHGDNVETIRVLLAAGANPNGHDPQAGWCSQPPLWIAASSDHIENVRALLEAGASIQPPPMLQRVTGMVESLDHRVVGSARVGLA